MNSTKVTLSDYQIDKLKYAYKHRGTVNIRFRYEQLLKGTHYILLTEDQMKLLTKAKSKRKGITLDISYEQLQQNHSGGFLPLVFAGLGALGALLGGGASIANSVVNAKNKKAELEELKRHNRSIEELETGVKGMAVGYGLKKAKRTKA